MDLFTALIDVSFSSSKNGPRDRTGESKCSMVLMTGKACFDVIAAVQDMPWTGGVSEME